MIDPTIAIVLSYLETSELIKLCRSDETYKIITRKYIKEFKLKNRFVEMTDDDIKSLCGIQIINLSGCSRITDRGLENLKGVKVINLARCYKITSHGLQFLKGVKKINLSDCHGITDSGLGFLKDVEAINLFWCRKIT